jgi:hypothetical protein
MPQQELLKKVVKILEDLKIPYMLTGSIASSLYGEPRSTQEIDIVVEVKSDSIESLVKQFPASQYYIDAESIKEAIHLKLMFNLIDINEGEKVDFWIVTDEPFDTSRFSRRQKLEIYGMKMYVSTPEDMILAKLRWSKLAGGSEKQFGDALRIFEVQYNKLDLNYLKEWMVELNIEDLWERIKKEAEV